MDTCDYAATRIDIVAGREHLEGSEANPTLGTVLTDRPQQGNITVNMIAPEAPWRVEQPLEARENPDLIIISSVLTDGSVAGRNEAIPQVSATMSEITALAPGEELTRTAAVAAAEFTAHCDEDDPPPPAQAFSPGNPG